MSITKDMDRKKKIWRSILIGYLFAAYLSLVPGYFINWTIPPDDIDTKSLTFLDFFWQVVSTPFLTPVRLCIEVMWTFSWGLGNASEGLIPLFVFIVVFGCGYFISYKHLTKTTVSERTFDK